MWKKQIPRFWRFMGANLADLVDLAGQMAMASMPCKIGDLDQPGDFQPNLAATM